MSTLLPSHFADLGDPHCSMWCKAELEWLAHDYVKALVANGNTWAKLTREQAAALLPEKQRTAPMDMFGDEYYQRWFDMVSEQLDGPDGASKVWRPSADTLAKLMGQA